MSYVYSCEGTIEVKLEILAFGKSSKEAMDQITRVFEKSEKMVKGCLANEVDNVSAKTFDISCTLVDELDFKEV